MDHTNKRQHCKSKPQGHFDVKMGMKNMIVTGKDFGIMDKLSKFSLELDYLRTPTHHEQSRGISKTQKTFLSINSDLNCFLTYIKSILAAILNNDCNFRSNFPVGKNN